MWRLFDKLIDLIWPTLSPRARRVVVGTLLVVMLIALTGYSLVPWASIYQNLSSSLSHDTVTASNNSGGQNGNVTNNGPVYSGTVFQSSPHPVTATRKRHLPNKHIPTAPSSSNPTISCPPNTFDCELGTNNTTKHANECGYSRGYVRGGAGNTQEDIKGQRECPPSSKPN